MGLEIEIAEQRLRSFIVQLQTECGILERVVYKNKNQHRRCSYFHYLLKVRRDLRLLKSANLEEILNASFSVINGNRPKQKVQLLESLKRRKSDGGKYNFVERLLGVSRLLSQILLDVVHVFNAVSSLSQKEQTIKLNQKGFEVFREYYPAKEQATTFLECIWQTDKFVLVERANTSESKSQDKDIGEDIISSSTSRIQYENVEVLLGVDDSSIRDTEHVSEEGPIRNTSSVALGTVGPFNKNEVPLEETSARVETDKKTIVPPEKQFESKSSVKFPSQGAPLPASPTSCPVKLRTDSKKVAFLSVKRPAPSAANQTGFQVKRTKNDSDKEDTFFNLLNAGNENNSLF